MNELVKRLVAASLVNLIGNSLGTIVALQRRLPADWGGALNGQDVLRDFLGFKGTALSAPLPFLLIQLALIGLALRADSSGRIGLGGLAFVGLFYALAQVGEPIVWRQLSPGGLDRAQAVILFVNIASSVAMLVFGIQAWRAKRTSNPVAK